MNRRSFIGTITALAGLALAKIKAPAKPKDYLAANYSGDFRWLHSPQVSQDFVYFTQHHVYVQSKDGLYRWQPTPTQQYLLGCKPIDKPKELL